VRKGSNSVQSTSHEKQVLFCGCFPYITKSETSGAMLGGQPYKKKNLLIFMNESINQLTDTSILKVNYCWKCGYGVGFKEE
jgi:hypothetical protein